MLFQDKLKAKFAEPAQRVGLVAIFALMLSLFTLAVVVGVVVDSANN